MSFFGAQFPRLQNHERVKLNEIVTQMSGGRSSISESVVGVLAEPKQTLGVWNGCEVHLTFKNSNKSQHSRPS